MRVRSSRAARTAFAMVAVLGCAGAPPGVEPAACPAPGPRHAEAPPFPIAGDAARGGRLFLEECEGCHARTPAMRRPDAPAAAPRLDCPEWLAPADAAYLYHAIHRGPGLHGHGAGPPLGLRLAPMDVADLVAYLQSLGDE